MLERDLCCQLKEHQQERVTRHPSGLLYFSPELLTGKKFRHLLQDPHFRSMVKWVIVDELHLVSVWGEEFRKSYAMLEVIRHTLGHKPWFGCIFQVATLASLKS